MRSLVLAVLATAALSVPSDAQLFRSRNGTSAAEALALPPRVPPGVAALALDHAAELALADSQKVLLESIRHAQDSANKPWIARLDSLRPTRRPVNPNDLSPEQQEEIAARRAAIATVLDAMRGTDSLARQRTMALLTPEQQERAAELENDARKQSQEELARRLRDDVGREERWSGRGRLPED